MSVKIRMIYKLETQKLKKSYVFNNIDLNNIDNLASSMLKAFENTEDFKGETKDKLAEELLEVIQSNFGIFISEASFQINQNDQIASAILVSLYKEKPLISELFTRREFMNLGMASELLKKSINKLILLGYKELVLYVHPKNIKAIKVYKKIGFIEK